MLQKLDKILLSENVCENFLQEYQNPEFKEWLISAVNEIEDCAKTEQDNPWHIYNCLEHILHSVEEINKQTKDLEHSERRVLAYSMFLHDIGKPETKVRRFAKKYQREVDSFFNHNRAGVKIADRVLGNFKFTQTEQEQIKTLIKEHDMFMSITTKEENTKSGNKLLSTDLLKDEIYELDKIGDGEKLMQYLIYVAKADNLAQNPEMTKESLEKIDVAQQYLNEIKAEKEAEICL